MTDLDLSNDIETVLPTCIGEIDSHKCVRNSICITGCSRERIAEVEAWVWDCRDPASQNDEACYAYKD